MASDLSGLDILVIQNIIETMMGTIRRVCRDVKRWRSPAMALC